MNIFRILASGKLSFREEHVSAFLAYLLNPRMDHGLHAEILKRLVDRVGHDRNIPVLIKLASRLEPQLRSNLDDVTDDDVLVDLEVAYDVPNTTRRGFIDVVVKTKECFILIENKIVASSATNDQISEQYAGFIKRLRPKIEEINKTGTLRPVISLYVVPAELSGGKIWLESESACDECNKIVLQPGDHAAVISWQPVSKGISIVGILDELLKEDEAGRISPISYDMRQLIRAFIDFSLNEFCGFEYQRITSTKKSGQSKVADLLHNNESKLYVGIQYGLAGLISRAWKNPGFSNEFVSVSEQERGWQYVLIDEFKAVATWAMDPTSNNGQLLRIVRWQGMPFWTQMLYFVSQAAGDSIWIGIRGGLDALEAMSSQEVLARRNWQVSNKQKSKQWFSGSEFCKALDNKGITFDSPKM